MKSKTIIEIILLTNDWGVATNSGLGGGDGQVQIETFFCIGRTNVVQKSLMLLYCVNNIKHNIKQDIYTGMEVISPIPP